MLKWFFKCRRCGGTTTTKTSGSIYPKDLDKEKPKVMCCEHYMQCDGVGDSSQF